MQLIPGYYLRFRNSIFQDKKQIYFDSTRIKEIKEKRLISDIEIDIILFIILSNADKYISKNLNYATSNSGNDLIENIKSTYKNLVTVDEATDFSSVTLGCMFYLTNPLIRSFTLSGDLMQRVTDSGIKNWDECKLFLPEPVQKDLTQVYRQSPKLLNIAFELYKHFVGKPPFKSVFEVEEKDPDPANFKNGRR